MSEAPERITNVSHGYFSIARHYGGIKFNGKHYVYNPILDELVRDDVLKREAKERRESAKITPTPTVAGRVV